MGEHLLNDSTTMDKQLRNNGEAIEKRWKSNGKKAVSGS
jgi:hypothetical protein